MTGIANAVARSVRYKAYSDASITPGLEADYTSDPGSSGGQVLRVTPGVKMNLQKGIVRSNERRIDRQRIDVRHAGRRAPIEIPAELSPGTYADFLAAILRGTWAGGVSKTQADFTSLTASNSSSNFTLGSSDFVTLGLKIGDVIRIGGADVAAWADKGKNFQIVAFTNTNTKATVYPAPATLATVSTAVTLSVPGKKLFPPETAPVKRKFLFELYSSDIDESLLYTEARMGGCKIAIPNEGMVTATFSGLARNQAILPNASAPFFASPTAETTTSIVSSVGGQLLFQGVPVAVITAADLDISIGTSAQNVVFNPLPPEIFTGDLDVTGNLTVDWLDDTFLSAFDLETECELALMLTTNSIGTGAFISAFMGRVKLLGSDINDNGNEGIPITMPFQALKKSTTTGYDAATIVIQDTAA